MTRKATWHPAVLRIFGDPSTWERKPSKALKKADKALKKASKALRPQKQDDDAPKAPKIASSAAARFRTELFESQGGRCALCTRHYDIDAMTIDHVVPRSRGGSNHMRNLQLLCLPCNRLKADRIVVRSSADVKAGELTVVFELD